MQSAVARGLEAAGSNAAGSAAGYMGMGFGHAGSRRGHERGQRRQPPADADESSDRHSFSGNGRGRAVLPWTCACGTVKHRKVLQRVRKAQTRRKMDLQLRHGKFGEILQ